MGNYVVRWVIDITDVDTPEEAAWRARVIQLDPENIATCFEVTSEDNVTHDIDLLDDLDTE